MQDESFVIDTSPEIKEKNFQVPRYQIGRKSVELIKDEQHSSLRIRNQPYTVTSQCWNCGKTNHGIRDCPFVVNAVTLEWNRELHSLSRNYQNKMFQKGAGRYHQTEKISNYSHVKPGTVSAGLKRALGLHDSELPPYIYRLRRHGYPKAWLKHATVRPSGMNLYDAQGNEVIDPDTEDGEVVDEEDKIRYDLDKLIQFPGFNSPMPENVVDECDKFSANCYDEAQSLESMIRALKEKALPEYRLKKKAESENTVTTDDNENSQLECENAAVSSRVSEDDDSTMSSELNETAKEISDCNSSVTVEENSTSPQENPYGHVLSRSVGTPLLASKSRHSRLPPPENFSKDICDVLHFENLPESTGKFESMRGLLRKVKQILGIQRNSTV